jgi:hypothetical protein
LLTKPAPYPAASPWAIWAHHGTDFLNRNILPGPIGLRVAGGLGFNGFSGTNLVHCSSVKP